ncbi:MAG TPA: AI-2E family transporter, partial [Bacteroidia bacterium]|nr:AI-2E family transporter [Bacteroidia bacterium]
PVCKSLEQKGVNRVIAILIGVIAIVVITGLLLFLLYTQFRNFILEWPVISVKISELIGDFKIFLTSQMGFSQQQVDLWFSDILNSSARNTIAMLQTTLISFFVNLVMLVLIPIYAFLILYYRTLLVEVLYSLFPSDSRPKIAEVIGLSIKTYYDFIKGMAIVYLIVGVLNSIGLLLLGIPHAFLFGFMTAIMTFIPYVGIIVASLLPISYAWITYNSIWYPMGVIGVFTVVQYLEANIIFPWAVSQRLQLNTLVTLAVIVVGGILWGAAGMILFIPFAGILKLIADRMEGWEAISKFLGKG